MSKRELSLSILVIIGLVFTASMLKGEDAYDCRQDLFSTVSTCSLDGGTCIRTQERAGITGLWSFVIGENCPLVSSSCNVAGFSTKSANK